MLGLQDTLATTSGSGSGSGSGSDTETDTDDEVQEELDPFADVVKEARQREEEEAARLREVERVREAAKNDKKKSKSSKKRQRSPASTSTPASKKPRGQEATSAAPDQSVLMLGTKKGDGKKPAAISDNSATPGNSNSPAPPHEKQASRKSSKHGKKKKKRDQSSSSSSSTEVSDSSEEEENEVTEEKEKEKKKKSKKKKSHKKGSESEDDASKLVSGLMSLVRRKKKKGKKSKKRSRSSSNSSSSDSDTDCSPVMTEKLWKLRDNGVDVVDMDLRHLLRVPTSDPDTWFKPPFKSKVSRPIRGASLNMEPSLGHSRVHDTTVRRCHDRTALLTTKMLLGKNADISLKDAKVMKIDDDKVSYSRSWASPESVSEIAEAVQNFVSLVYYTRCYSYEAIAISRSLHDSGWLLGAVSSEREQLDLLETLLDKLLSRNSQRARTGLPPMQYEQVRAATKSFLHSKGKSEAGLYGVDPYAGKRKLTDEARMKQDIEASLTAKFKSWNKADGPVRERRQKVKNEDKKKKKEGSDGASKVSKLCKDFNSQSGCSSQGDCAKGEHKCSRRKGDFVCQRTGHNRLDCDHPKLVKDGGH